MRNRRNHLFCFLLMAAPWTAHAQPGELVDDRIASLFLKRSLKQIVPDTGEWTTIIDGKVRIQTLRGRGQRWRLEVEAPPALAGRRLLMRETELKTFEPRIRKETKTSWLEAPFPQVFGLLQLLEQEYWFEMAASWKHRHQETMEIHLRCRQPACLMSQAIVTIRQKGAVLQSIQAVFAGGKQVNYTLEPFASTETRRVVNWNAGEEKQIVVLEGIEAKQIPTAAFK